MKEVHKMKNAGGTNILVWLLFNVFVSAVQNILKQLWCNTGITGHIVTVKTFSPTGAKVCCRASLAQRPTRSGRTLRLSSTVNSPPSTIKLRRKTRSERHKKGSSLPEETAMYTAIDQVTLSVKQSVTTRSKKKEEAHTVCVGKQ